MSTAFEIVAAPQRRRILELLQGGERPVNDLVDELSMAQPAVSKHLRVLRDAGFVAVRQEAQQRFYRLQPEPLVEIDEWITPFRHAWARRLDALEAHLDAMEER